MLVIFIQTLALGLVDECVKVHEALDASVFSLTALVSNQLLDLLFQGISICSLHPVNLSLVSKEDESGHRRDSLGSCGFLTLVYVHLQKNSSAILGAEFFEEGRNSFTRSAPAGSEVYNDELGPGSRQLSLKMSIILDYNDSHVISLVEVNQAI